MDNEVRSVKRVVAGERAVDGAGVRLVRVLGRNEVDDFDPFLLLDAFDSHDPDDYIKGFPWHPHRGIETVTYLVAGKIEHGDSLGNKGVITDGSCQWMTGGGGIVHQEMPQASPRMLGLQLWLNLPKADKLAPPAYRDLTPDKIPLVERDGFTVSVIAGEFDGVKGATGGDYVTMQLLDVSLGAGRDFLLPTDPKATVFLYIMEGDGECGAPAQKVPTRRAVLFNPGAQLHAKAGPSGMRFVTFAARPLGEPIAWGGPIVMNTEDEIRQAFKELKEGTFIR